MKLRFKKAFLIFWWGAIVFVYLLIFAQFLAYDAFYATPDYDQLNIRTGILTKIGPCEHPRRGKPYIQAEILNNGKSEYVKLPCGQQVSSLEEEIGESIELRYDPNHLSFLSSIRNVWHVATKKRVYYDYRKAIDEFSKGRQDKQNLSFIIIVFTFVFILKNIKAIKEYFSGFTSEIKKIESTNIKDTITFKPDYGFDEYLLYVTSILTIVFMYYGLFVYPFLLVFGIPLMFLVPWGYSQTRKYRYSITLSPNGIKYELFKRQLPTDTVRWSEIDQIETDNLGGTEMVLIKLVDRKKTSLLSKIENLSYDLYFYPKNLKNGDYLKNKIIEMHNAYRSNKEQHPIKKQDVSFHST